MVDAPLQDTTSMAMSADDDTVGADSFVDELSILRTETVKAFLNDMITIQVLNKINNMLFQSVNHGLGLFRSRNELNHLLQSTGSMLVKGNLDQLRGGVVDKCGALLIIGKLKKLLAQVVAEGI